MYLDNFSVDGDEVKLSLYLNLFLMDILRCEKEKNSRRD